MIFRESTFSSVVGGLEPSKLLLHDADWIIVAYSHHISAHTCMRPATTDPNLSMNMVDPNHAHRQGPLLPQLFGALNLRHRNHWESIFVFAHLNLRSANRLLQHNLVCACVGEWSTHIFPVTPCDTEKEYLHLSLVPFEKCLSAGVLSKDTCAINYPSTLSSITSKKSAWYPPSNVVIKGRERWMKNLQLKKQSCVKRQQASSLNNVWLFQRTTSMW